MNDMREKLVELIEDVLGYLPWGEISPHTASECADHLIANGVTVADGKDTDVPDNNVGNKWIPVTERLPEAREVVLACGKRHATSGMFQGVLRNNPKMWHWKGNTLKEVTHWMPLPELPED